MADRDERVAANEATFRKANREIRARAAEIGVDDSIPFICECHQESCTEILLLTPDQYTRVRGSATCFFIVPGHVAPSTEAVIESRGHYEVVEKKTDAARKIVEDTADD